MRRMALAILALSLAGSGASANPRVDPRILELGALPRAILERGSIEDEERFALLLGQVGMRWMRPESLVLVEEHFDRFRRALVRSQRPGVGIDPGVQAMLRARLDGAWRDTTMAQLRDWLRYEGRPRKGRRDRSESPDRAEDIARCQVLAAAELVAWRDPAGPGAIRDRIERAGPEDAIVPALRKALEHVDDPCLGRITTSDERGRMRRCLGLSKVRADFRYTYYRQPGIGTSQSRRLRASEVDSLLRAIDGAREGLGSQSGWSLSRATILLSDAGREAEGIDWHGGPRFTVTRGAALFFGGGPAFTCEAAGALLERWTSRPVTLDDEP